MAVSILGTITVHDTIATSGFSLATHSVTSGTDTLLALWISRQHTATVGIGFTATWAGNALTEIRTNYPASGTDDIIHWVGAINTPTTGAQTFVFDTNAEVQRGGTLVLFNLDGCDTTDLMGANTAQRASTTAVDTVSLTIIPETTGNLVIAALGIALNTTLVSFTDSALGIASIIPDTSAIAQFAIGSDTWVNTWHNDGNIYAFWGDGNGFAAPNRKSAGISRLTGTPPSITGTDIWYGAADPSEAGTEFDGKSYGLLSIGSNMYMWFGRNTNETRLKISTNNAVSWTNAGNVNLGFGFFNNGTPSFMQIDGPGYTSTTLPAAITDYAYSYYQIQHEPGQIGMFRQPVSNMTTLSAIEHFGGRDASGDPIWVSSIASRAVLLSQPFAYFNSCSVQWSKYFGRYIMIAAYPTTNVMVGTQNRGIAFYQASQPWGPFTLISKNETFLDRTTGTFYLPPKWMAANGSAWMTISGGNWPPNTWDCLSLAEVQITGATSGSVFTDRSTGTTSSGNTLTRTIRTKPAITGSQTVIAQFAITDNDIGGLLIEIRAAGAAIETDSLDFSTTPLLASVTGVASQATAPSAPWWHGRSAWTATIIYQPEDINIDRQILRIGSGADTRFAMMRKAVGTTANVTSIVAGEYLLTDGAVKIESFSAAQGIGPRIFAMSQSPPDLYVDNIDKNPSFISGASFTGGLRLDSLPVEVGAHSGSTALLPFTGRLARWIVDSRSSSFEQSRVLYRAFVEAHLLWGQGAANTSTDANRGPIALPMVRSLTGAGPLVIAPEMLDPDGTVPSITATTTPTSGGTATIVGTSIHYTPPANFTGRDLFTYTISDGTKTSTAWVAVDRSTAGLVAQNDEISLLENTSLTFDPRTNDEGAQGPVTIISVTQPSIGSVTIEPDGRLRFVAPPIT